jgi:hypothetical protein
MKGGISDDFLVTIFSSQAVLSYLSNRPENVKPVPTHALFPSRPADVSPFEFQELPGWNPTSADPGLLFPTKERTKGKGSKIAKFLAPGLVSW